METQLKPLAASHYQALISRDPRFDGALFVGVTTTGIYCRPVCPAPKPRQKNCVFLASAAAGEEAGFRACKRCRPETAPASPAWAGTGTTVARALRLIEGGALNEQSVDDLAGRLGVTARHLRRLFLTHLGASPQAVARTQRLHLAKQLLETSGLSMTEVAHGAGYQSLRRFNDDFKRAHGCPPSALRAGKPAGPKAKTANVLHLTLGYRPPLDWPAMLDFFRPRAVAGLERVSGNAYERIVRVGTSAALIRVAPDERENRLHVEVHSNGPLAVAPVTRMVRDLLDLDADPETIHGALSADPALRPIAGEARALRVPGCPDLFELCVRAVIGQQISVVGAATVLSRLVQTCGTRIDPPLTDDEDGPRYIFPDARAVAKADLGPVRLTRARAATLHGLAEAVLDGRLSLTRDAEPETLRAQLLSLKGIGPWSAGYIVMRGLKDPDGFPDKDLGLIKAAQRLGIAPESLSQAAQSWRPWRAYAAVMLWRSLNDALVAKPAARKTAAKNAKRNASVLEKRP